MIDLIECFKQLNKLEDVEGFSDLKESYGEEGLELLDNDLIKDKVQKAVDIVKNILSPISVAESEPRVRGDIDAAHYGVGSMSIPIYIGGLNTDLSPEEIKTYLVDADSEVFHNITGCELDFPKPAKSPNCYVLNSNGLSVKKVNLKIKYNSVAKPGVQGDITFKPSKLNKYSKDRQNYYKKDVKKHNGKVEKALDIADFKDKEFKRYRDSMAGEYYRKYGSIQKNY